MRARLAATRVSGRDFAIKTGERSQNYVAIRLRDEAPFNLDDLEWIADYFQQDGHVFATEAMDHHGERLSYEEILISEGKDAADAAADELSARRGRKRAAPQPDTAVARPGEVEPGDDEDG